MWPFSDFYYGFRSSRSTADLLTVISDRIARGFNRSGATGATALDVSKAFDRVYRVYNTFYDLPDGAVCNIATYADDTTL